MHNRFRPPPSDSDDLSDDDMKIDNKSVECDQRSKLQHGSVNQQNDRSNQSWTGRMIGKLKETFRSTPLPMGMESGSSASNLTFPPLVTFSPQPAASFTHTDNQQQVRRGSTGAEPIVAWHPYEIPEDNFTSNQHHKSCYCSHTSYPSSDSDISSDSVHSLDPAILDSNVTMALANNSTKQMRVQQATEIHDNRDEDYKMTAKPRGPCLIVNNIDFESDIFPTRKGSDEDARRFDDIFNQLGFQVIMRRNQTAEQMRQLFKDVAAQCKPEHNALFVFILSHGSEHGIYGTDGIEVCLESEIISCFDNRNCKSMLGKPKVFVIQACRGRSKDCGGDGDAIDSVAWPTSSSPSNKSESLSFKNIVPTSWLPSSQPSSEEGKPRKHPVRTDMLLVFSCLAGFVSVRNELAGSWLGVALAYFIMTHAHERDLESILKKVTVDVTQRVSSNGHIQSIEVKQLGWRKHLYFNPGYYRKERSAHSSQ